MKGFVVINTIFVISLIALIILTLQSRLQLDIKIVNQLTISHRAFQELESAALKIIMDSNSYNIIKKCQYDYNSDEFSYENILKHGCGVLNRNIYYSITDLGEFPCLRIYKEHMNLATHHYLLNIVSRNFHSKILKIRYVTPGPNLVCKNSKPRYVEPGLLSWLIFVA